MRARIFVLWHRQKWAASEPITSRGGSWGKKSTDMEEDSAQRMERRKRDDSQGRVQKGGGALGVCPSY